MIIFQYTAKYTHKGGICVVWLKNGNQTQLLQSKTTKFTSDQHRNRWIEDRKADLLQYLTSELRGTGIYLNVPAKLKRLISSRYQPRNSRRSTRTVRPAACYTRRIGRDGVMGRDFGAWRRPRVIAYTDGSFHPIKRKAGIGVWFSDAAGAACGPHISEEYRGPVVTSQRAELAAIVKALEVTKGKDIEIRTDSKYAMDGSTLGMQAWKEKGLASARKRIENIDLFLKIDTLSRGREVVWTKVRSHVDPGNIKADHLARRAIGLDT